MLKRLYKQSKGRSKEQNVGIKKSEPDCKKVKIQFYPPEENDALVIGFSRGKGGGGGTPGHMWGNQGPCGNFATNSNDAPTRGENVGRGERNLGASCVFARLKKRLPGRTRMCVLKSIDYYFIFCVCMK